jgi:hypothetical protein
LRLLEHFVVTAKPVSSSFNLFMHIIGGGHPCLYV